MRLDALLVEKGIARSRERAKQLIESGSVSLNGKIVSKASAKAEYEDIINVSGEIPDHVGRGYYKLEKALAVSKTDPTGCICIDIGASTGGFTECLLDHGAKTVFAADVGHGQLDGKLIADTRVVNMEGTDIRSVSVSDFPSKADIICCDVSFISLKLILPKIAELLDVKGCALLLIKPQFECGRADVGKNGIVRSQKVHIRVISGILSSAAGCGLYADMLDFSPICGGDGNIEYISRFSHTAAEYTDISLKIVSTVRSAFETLPKRKE